MRFKLRLNRTDNQRMIPMDYQYYISAWIYKVLKQADAEFATFLHQEGYGSSPSKLYKLFCFSRLDFGKPTLWKEKKLFEISRHDISLTLSFDVQEVASNFIKGLFQAQEFYLGDRFNGIDFRVTNVEALSEPLFSTTMHYRLQTPWVVSSQPDKTGYPRYLAPGDDLFNELSVKHIAEKFKNTRGKEAGTISFTPGKSFKRAGFLIKPGSTDETRIVGNLFDFELNAPVEVHQMVWNAGISEKSSNGFGWVEIA